MKLMTPDHYCSTKPESECLLSSINTPFISNKKINYINQQNNKIQLKTPNQFTLTNHVFNNGEILPILNQERSTNNNKLDPILMTPDQFGAKNSHSNISKKLDKFHISSTLQYNSIYENDKALRIFKNDEPFFNFETYCKSVNSEIVTNGRSFDLNCIKKDIDKLSDTEKRKDSSQINLPNLKCIDKSVDPQMNISKIKSELNIKQMVSDEANKDSNVKKNSESANHSESNGLQQDSRNISNLNSLSKCKSNNELTSKSMIDSAIQENIFSKKNYYNLNATGGLAPIGIFWDIENMRVPRTISVGQLIANIRYRFLQTNYEAEFVCACNARNESEQFLADLNNSEISIVHVGSYKNAADQKLLKLMNRFSNTFGEEGKIVILTNDRDFEPIIYHLRYRLNLYVILVHMPQAPTSLRNVASQTIPFSEIVNVWTPPMYYRHMINNEEGLIFPDYPAILQYCLHKK